MAIEWVNGANSFNNENVTITYTPIAGNTLILSVGFLGQGALAEVFPFLTDTKDNIWLPPISTPVQLSNGGPAYQLLTFVAVNVAGGSTVITVNGTSNDGMYLVAVDEYSGVLAVNPIDTFSFASTLYNQSPPAMEVNSGNIIATSGELIYSAAFAGIADPETFIPTSGFIQRQNFSGNLGYYASMATYDQQSTGGTYFNNVSVEDVGYTLHANILSLSATPIDRPLVQIGVAAVGSVSPTNIEAIFPYPNTAGNLLVAYGYAYEATDASIEDILGNDWNVIYTAEGGSGNVLVMAYCLNCLPGSNTVTMNMGGGGDDVVLDLVIAEYNFKGTYIVSSQSTKQNQESTSTGFVPTGILPSLFISMAVSDTEGDIPFYPGTASQLGTLRYQFSFAGFVNIHQAGVSIADQTINSSGSVQNTFNFGQTGTLQSAILGFASLPPNCFLVDFPLSGPYYDANGQPLANGSLSIRLVFDCNCPCADYQITGNNHSFIQLDENGNVLGNPQVRPNDQLAPSGSYYILQGYSNSGQLVYGPKVVTVLST